MKNRSVTPEAFQDWAQKFENVVLSIQSRIVRLPQQLKSVKKKSDFKFISRTDQYN